MNKRTSAIALLGMAAWAGLTINPPGSAVPHHRRGMNKRRKKKPARRTGGQGGKHK